MGVACGVALGATGCIAGAGAGGTTVAGAASGVAGPVQDSGNANPDYDFRNVGGSGQNSGYVFNLDTSGLATGTYALQFSVSGDPVPHTVFFGVN